MYGVIKRHIMQKNDNVMNLYQCLDLRLVLLMEVQQRAEALLRTLYSSVIWHHSYITIK